jgi:hypothetical protein
MTPSAQLITLPPGARFVAGAGKKGARPEPPERRTGSRVRRYSRFDTGIGDLPYLSKGDARRRLLAFDREALAKRAALGKGQRWGGKTRTADGKVTAESYSHFASPILGWMLDLWVAFGRVFPSAEAIAAEVGCSVRTVHRVKQQLMDGGWLRWIRRCEPTGTPGPRGELARQISNLYVVLLPASAAQVLAAWEAAAAKRRGDAADQAARAHGAALNDAHHAEWEADRALAIEAERKAAQAAAAERLRNAHYAVTGTRE